MTPPSQDKLRFECRKIFIRSLVLPCILGVYEHEKTAPQRVEFNCDVWVSLAKSTSAKDDIADVLDYTRIAAIIAEAAKTPFNLQESLIDAVADQVSALPGVELVRASCAKLDACESAEAVGVEVWRAPSL